MTTPPLICSENPPVVCCVVVNWNGWEDTIACLQSLQVQDYSAMRVLLVDNGSTNESVQRIRAAIPDVSLIETGRNLGFPSGTNVGIRKAVAEGADYIWLLNNDTIAPPNTCSQLVAAALRQPDPGMVGTVLYYTHDPSQVQAWGGGQYSKELGRTIHAHKPFVIDRHSYLTFASALIPTEVLRKVGILFEGYFMYWDDVDLAERIHRAGYRLFVAESTAVLHKEGGSADIRSPNTDRFATASGLFFLRRHATIPLVSMMFYVTSKFAVRLLRGHGRHGLAIVNGVCDYLRKRHNIYIDKL